MEKYSAKYSSKVLGGSLALALILLMFLVSGCQWPGIKDQAVDTPPPVLIKVQIQFTGNSEPLIGYVKDLDISKNEILQGGSSVNYLYDQTGQEMAVFNYARVEYIKIVP